MKLGSLSYLGMGFNKISDIALGFIIYLENIAVNFPNLISLDISFNLISKLKTIESFTKMNLKILNLFGNPICLSCSYPF